MKKYAIGLLLCAVTGYASAGNDYSKTVGRIGIQGNNAYFTLKEGLSTNCQFGVVYMNITTDFGKLAYANVLSAKATSTKLIWVSYDQVVSGGQCILNTAEMAD
jgi:hypothetical protein